MCKLVCLSQKTTSKFQAERSCGDGQIEIVLLLESLSTCFPTWLKITQSFAETALVSSLVHSVLDERDRR